MSATKATVEFEVSFAILAVGLLNAVIFTSLSNWNNATSFILPSIPFTLAVYVIYLIASTACILFKQKKWLSIVFKLLLSFMTLHVIANLLVLFAFPNSTASDARTILIDAFMLWGSGVLVFSLWYWVIDRDGPVQRMLERDETRYDLLFPQYQTKIAGWAEWKPRFLDYIFFSFFTSTGFSPADTLPLTKRIKFLMMIEATTSLITISMVISRALT